MRKRQGRLSGAIGLVAASLLVSAGYAQTGTQHIYLGPADPDAWDQPRCAWELRDPVTGQTIGPIGDWVGGLLDTGANGVVLGQLAYFYFDWDTFDFGIDPDMYEVARRTDGSRVQYEEIGVAGTEFFDVLASYTLAVSPGMPLFGTTGEWILTPDVRAFGSVDLALGPSAVVGMPTMIGRRINIDTSALATIGFLDTQFVDDPIVPTATTYQVRLERLVAEHTGQVFPDDPVPTFSDLPLVSGFTVVSGDRSSTDTVLLDTGAQLSMITSDVAARLGLILDPDHPNTAVIDYIEVGGIGGNIDVPLVYLDRVIIPTVEGVDLVMTNLLVGVVDVPGIGGIFGMNMLTSGQVPALLGDGAPGYFDSVFLDFTEEEMKMWLTVHPAFHNVSSDPFVIPSQTLTWKGTENSRWNALLPGNWAEHESLKYYDGDHVFFGDNVTTRTIDIVAPVAPGSIVVDNSEGLYRFFGEPITGSTGLVKRGTSGLMLHNSNTYTGKTEVFAGSIVFAAVQNIGDVKIHAGASAEFRTSQRLGALDLDGQAVVTRGGSKVMFLKDLQIGDTGRLDLAEHAAVILAGAGEGQAVLGNVVEQILRSRDSAGNAWLGAGLGSSAVAETPNTTLAAMLNDDGTGKPIIGSIQGRDLDVNAVLVKFTWNGDMNLDGQVDADDYFLIDSGFLRQNVLSYRNGDLNYDDRIDADDYFLIDKAFLSQGDRLGWPVAGMAGVPVPEPGALGLLLAGSLLGLRRRGNR